MTTLKQVIESLPPKRAAEFRDNFMKLRQIRTRQQFNNIIAGRTSMRLHQETFDELLKLYKL